MHLAPGEWAVAEGGERALFAVLAVTAAVGEGSMAIALVHQYLQQDRPESWARLNPPSSRSP